MAENMFNRPPRRQTGMDTFAMALQGFGAGLEGRGAEFFALEDQRQQQLDERRQKAMAQDAMRVYGYLNEGKTGDAMELIQDRAKSIIDLGGDPSDTLEIGRLILTGQTNLAQQELGGFLELAMQNGLIERPEKPEAYTLSPGEVRFEGGRQVAAVPAAAAQEPESVRALRLRAEAAGLVPGTAEYAAYMMNGGPASAQTEPAPLTDIGRINRAEQNREITPEQADEMRNALIQKQEIELATGQAKTEDTAQQQALVAMETKRIYDLTNKLLGNEQGLSGATGPISSMIPSFRQSTVDFEADLAELQNLLTMTNLGRMTGVLSQSDIELIRNAASGISERGSEQRMRSKLLEIQTRILPKLIDAGILSADGSAPMGDVPPIPSQYRGVINDDEWQAMTPEERAAF